MVYHEGSASFIENHAPNTPNSSRSATTLNIHGIHHHLIGDDVTFPHQQHNNAATQVSQKTRESAEIKRQRVSFQYQQHENAATQVSQKMRISSVVKRLKAKDRIPTDMEALPDSTFAEDPFMKEEFRPETASTVLQYADAPIQITQHPLGRPTRATILRNLRRIQSAPSVCSEFSWIKENRRLCNIRDYYRLCKPPKYVQGESVHAYLTGARYTSARWLDSVCLETQGLYVNKENLRNVFHVPNPPDTSHRKNRKVSGTGTGTGTGKKKPQASNPTSSNVLQVNGIGYKNIGTNTEPHYLSVKKWHGAEWQINLPDCYKPMEERYNSFSSTNLKVKRVKSEYRDPVKMAILRERENQSALQINEGI